MQAGSWHRQAVSSAGSQSRAGRPAVGRSCARQGARAMPFCPTASNPRAASPGTLACWQALFQHHHSFFSWLCHSAEWQPAQPSPALWAARGTETARGRVGQQRSWHRYGRGYSAVGLCPGTSRTLGWVAPTRAGRPPHGLGMASLCLPSQDGRLRWWGQGCRAQPCTVGTFLCYSSTVPQFPFTQLGLFQLPPLPASVARCPGDVTITPALEPCGDLAGSGSAWRNHQASEGPGFHPGKNGAGGMRHVGRRPPLPAPLAALGKHRSHWALA